MFINKIFKAVVPGFVFILYCNIAKTQESTSNAKDTAVKIDVLRAPSSPASTLLGMSPSDIEKPTDITAFMASLKNATNNFTSIPSNFSIEFAPFHLLNKTRPLDSKSLVENKENFRRSFVISLGIKKEEENDSLPGSKPKTEFGVGVKFAIIRGEIDDNSKKAFQNIWNFQDDLNDKQAELIKKIKTTDSVSLAIKKRKDRVADMFDSNQLSESEFREQTNELNELLNKREQQLFDSMQTEENKAIRKKISEEVKKIKLERKGFNLDFSAGTVVDFIDNKFDNSRMFKAGAWLTGGWNSVPNNFSLLFILRYLYNPKTSLADPELNLENLHTLDFGSRFTLTAMEKKLLFSGEAIYRSILKKPNATSSWRLILNAEYEIGINRRLTFSFGRNFDGTRYKSGNMISALSLLAGFGNSSGNAK